jgi:hypothetical protein
MNIALDLLDDLAGIGATIETAGDRLILKAGPTAIPAPLVSRIREVKPDLLAALARKRSTHGADENHQREDAAAQQSVCRTGRYTDEDEASVIQWLDDHPAPSPSGRCAWCGRPETLGAMVVPFGTEPGTHTWLHPECWSTWHRARRVEATAAILAKED